jgi:hypothetical protein
MLKVHKFLEEYCSFVSVLNIVEKLDTFKVSSIEVPDTYYFRTVTACNNFKLIDFQSKIDVLASDIFKNIKDLEIDSNDFNEIQNDLIQLEEYLNFRKKDNTIFRFLPTPAMNIEFYDEMFEAKNIVEDPNVFFDYTLKSIKLLKNYLLKLKKAKTPKLKFDDEIILTEENSEEINNEHPIVDNIQKIIWNGTVSDLAYFMLELNKKGWIELKKNNQNNFSTSATAKLLISHFKLSNGKDIELKNMENSFGLDKLQVSIDRLENELVIPLKK